MAEIHGAPVDEEGFLVNLGDWTEEIAYSMASDDDIVLTEEHWDVLNFLRNYYDEYQVAPAVRVLTKQIKKTMGKDKGNSKYLYSLFPYGPGKQGCRFAGLPKPTGCI
jgi:tRNA 2-thiouridine synthesizing protein E